VRGALSGRGIVNTRAVHQADALDSLLRAQGAIPLHYPAIAIVPPADTAALDAALFDLAAGRFEWLVLTSANTVRMLAERLQALGLTLTGKACRTAAVGQATAEAAREQLGLEHLMVPTKYVTESLAAHLPIAGGTRVLLPESAFARPTLAQHLSARGANVHVVEAYQTVCRQGGDALPLGEIDALTFTSSSTVTCFLERLQRDGGKHEDVLPVCAACIGTTVITAPQHTLLRLVDALENYFQQNGHD
jgi:uroporphyrinogen-III synthase